MVLGGVQFLMSEVPLYDVVLAASAECHDGLSFFRATGVPHLQENAPPLGSYRRPKPRVLGGS